jgi:uncharacterized membrane protein YdjX (TVP38/TMEM64 family)
LSFPPLARSLARHETADRFRPARVEVMTPAPTISPARHVVRALVLLLALAVFALALRWVKNSGLLDESLKWIQSLGPWAPAVFVLLFVATVIICLPAAILTAGGGFIFGFPKGAALVLLAAVISSNVTFLLGRHLARNWISGKLGGHPKFQAIDEAVAAEGWKIVALVRLAPVFPFSITSYAFGLTRVSWKAYFVANFAMIPGTFFYVYLGSIARDLTEKVSTPLWIKLTALALALVAVIYVARVAKRALAKRMS